MSGELILATITILGLVATVIIQNLIFHREREDLYNRMMCQSITEYKKFCDSGERIKQSPMDSAHKKSVNSFHKKGTEV